MFMLLNMAKNMYEVFFPKIPLVFKKKTVTRTLIPKKLYFKMTKIIENMSGIQFETA